MKISAMSDGFRLGFEGGIRKAAEIGLDGVQFHVYSAQPEHDKLLSEARAKEIRDLVSGCGIVISATCSELGGFNCADKAELEQRIERTGLMAHITAQLGVKITTAHIGQIPQDKNDPAYERIYHALVKIAGHCSDAGIRYAIETGPEKALTLKGMLEDVNRPEIGVNLDPANLVMCADDDPIAATLALGGYILHAHAKDGINLLRKVHKRWPVNHEGLKFIEVPLGEGEVDFSGWIAALKQIGFDGYMAIEREVGDAPEADIRMAFDFLRGII